MVASPVHFATSVPLSGDVVPFKRAGSTSSVAIAARGIEMVFPAGNERFRVLKSVDLKVKKGDVHLLMGPSGSGKTTLLLILAGLLTPTAGQVTLLGQDITHLSEAERSRFRLQNIGFVFQDCNLFPAMTALENVELVLQLKGVRRRIARQQAKLLLEEVGLAGKGHHLPRNLSGGQKQRVAIARALAGNPKLIVADEPTAALDAKSGQAVVALLKQLAKERDRTVLMVTHDPRIVHIADRIACLEDGILTEEPQRLRA